MTWKMISLATLLIVGFASEPNTASAQTGFFGPKNFDECVLKRMKGQNDRMLGHARSACRKEFPTARKLIQGEEVDYSWCDTKNDSIVLCLTLKGNVTVTEVVGRFAREECDAANSKSYGKPIVAKAPLFGEKYTFNVGPNHHLKCAQFEVWGYLQP